MRVLLILSVVTVVILAVVAYKQNTSLKNADTYIGKPGGLPTDYRKTPSA